MINFDAARPWGQLGPGGRRILLAAALGLGLALALLWGSIAWASRPTTVRVLMPAPFADSTAMLVESFNREHPDLRIVVTRGPLETEAVSDLAISSLLLGDSPYDLLLMDVTWTAKYAAAGWLLPLDGWLGPTPLAPLAPGARAGNRIDGTLWRLPMLADMGLLYWRTDLIAAPPQTPAELVAISERLQRQGKVRWGYVWQGRQYEGLSCVFLELLRGFGGNWQSSGEGLGSPAATRAASWLRELIVKGISPAAVANFAEPEALQSFEAGGGGIHAQLAIRLAGIAGAGQPGGGQGGRDPDGGRSRPAPWRHPGQLGPFRAGEQPPSCCCH